MVFCFRSPWQRSCRDCDIPRVTQILPIDSIYSILLWKCCAAFFSQEAKQIGMSIIIGWQRDLSHNTAHQAWARTGMHYTQNCPVWHQDWADFYRTLDWVRFLQNPGFLESDFYRTLDFCDFLEGYWSMKTVLCAGLAKWKNPASENNTLKIQV